MLEKMQFVYDVIENLEEKGYEVTDLEIHNNEVIITHNRYGMQITTKLDLDNLDLTHDEAC